MNGTTWRLPLALVAFYGTRIIVQNIFSMRFPEGYLWDYPGFYSLSVPYARTNDFFYSGHVGCAMLCSLEWKANGYKKMFYYSLLTMICQTILMIVVRGHYSIDLFVGLIIAHYYWILSEKYSYLIDVQLFHMPLHRRYPSMTKSCPNC